MEQPLIGTQLDTIRGSVMAMLGIDDKDFLNIMIPAVLGMMNSYTNRCLYKQVGCIDKFRTVTLMRDILFTRYFPIIQVTEVIEQDITLVSATDFEVDNPDAGRIRRLNSQGTWTQPWRGASVIKITYDAGFDSLPGDLVLVMAEVIDHAYKKKKQRDLTQDALPELSKLTIFDVGQVELPGAQGWDPGSASMNPVLGQFAQILDPYRMPASAGRDAFVASWIS